MSYHIQTLHLGNTFYLRNTVWTFDKTRASIYPSIFIAQDALTRASKFNTRASIKTAQIVAVDDVVTA